MLKNALPERGVHSKTVTHVSGTDRQKLGAPETIRTCDLDLGGWRSTGEQNGLSESGGGINLELKLSVRRGALGNSLQVY
jgi:hypothetical protein